MDLEIIYQDEYLLAINKPHGLLVHRSSIARDATENALNLLRNQINKNAHPAHRLDRKTSGVLLFSLNDEVNREMQTQFLERLVKKNYLAIVRGYTDDQGEIDYALKNDKGKSQEAFTKYKTIIRAELPIPFGINKTMRYSLVQVIPETGRMHQIRKHFAHIFHPIIGDRPHGCNKQNRFFKEHWKMESMFLHASALVFTHPINKVEIIIEAAIQREFKEAMLLMGWEKELEKFSQSWFSKKLEAQD